MKKKIAFVVQRYGLEVHGGAELLARLLAERSRSFYDAEVLTTCALDYSDWANHYPEGTEAVNEVKVRRFTVEKTRDMQMFSKMTVDPADRQAQQIWIDEQGPYCPKLIEYIKKNEAAYDVFIFVTYLYYHTVRGIGAVRDKAVLLPNAHDEPLIYYSIFKDIFTCPRAIAYNTEEEQAFIHELFDNNHVPSDIVGAGIEIPNNTDPVRFKEKYKTDEYILYSGRIDHGKNCPELFEYFIEYKKRNPSGLKLVLTGQEIIEVPEHPDILSLGFVSDEDRTDGMAGAKMLVLPSMYESLSMVVLESMALGVPVVVNSKCDVLKAHCLKSNAGLFYSGFHEFEGCIGFLLKNDDVYSGMKDNAKKYVEKNYRWDAVMDRFKALIDSI